MSDPTEDPRLGSERADPIDPEIRPVQLLVQRFADGELTGAARAEFEQRLATDPGLATALEDLERFRAPLKALAVSGSKPSVPADFRSRMVAQVRGRRPDFPGESEDVRPAPGGLSGSGPIHRISVWGARVVCAAALILAACAALAFGWFDRSESGDLSASPDRLQQEMDELDRQIEAADDRDGRGERR